MKYQGKYFNGMRGKRRKEKAKSARCRAVSVLLAAAMVALLTGCGGDKKGGGELESLTSADLLSEDGGSGAPGSDETDDSLQESGEAGKGAGEGTDGSLGKADAPGSDDAPGTEADDTQMAEAARPVPQIVENPFVDKLTEEGQGWGLSFGESGTQPVGNVTPEELAQYSGYFMGDAQEKVLYLTFDCGYENGNTEPILDALKKHEAPGTFFVVGHYLETQPELVKRMVEEGHAVGNHTYHHYDINTLDEETFLKELGDVASLFQEITGQELSPYYRPPEGKCGITNLKWAQKAGYFTCFWSLAHVDWDTDNQPSHQAALDKLTSRVHPGAIVLLHNTSQTNGEILDELLTKWEEMGYTFAPLSELVQ